ncbi:hypothetical protein PL321_07510 [Caloramator sp. mosi_1]|uniref:hypothetical protein n=1 Tax=Caloramator sp. mosi_1 TaxID=3023090 RepID=UPI0023602CF7|nr:hypothetical protein [Caloramator sp. mosi_1]WDC85281.1 hypothetical protein PL321_07510 [Caloramator sp. mosi_1]
MELILLKFLSKFKFLFDYLHIDFEILHKILEIKFKNDRRSKDSLFTKDMPKDSSKKSQIIGFILGVIF